MIVKSRAVRDETPDDGGSDGEHRAGAHIRNGNGPPGPQAGEFTRNVDLGNISEQ